jgi:hypothetical protein
MVGSFATKTAHSRPRVSLTCTHRTNAWGLCPERNTDPADGADGRPGRPPDAPLVESRVAKAPHSWICSSPRREHGSSERPGRFLIARIKAAKPLCRTLSLPRSVRATELLLRDLTVLSLVLPDCGSRVGKQELAFCGVRQPCETAARSRAAALRILDARSTGSDTERRAARFILE